DLVYGTYFGGPNTADVITAIAIDSQGVTYATGWTSSNDNSASAFPTTPGAYDTTPPKVPADVDAFVLRLNPAGNGAADLLYSTFLGAEALYPFSSQDRGKAIAVDSSGAVYVLGSTASDSFPTTPGAYRLASTASVDEVNIFLAKLRPLGSGAGDLEYATHVAEAYRDDQDVRGYSWRSLSVDDQGDVYIGGRIAENEQLATTLAAFDTDGGNSVVMRLRLAGQGADDLIYGSYFDSIVRVLTVVDTGEIALGAITNACDFPTTANAWQPNCAAGWIAGVAGLHTPERYLVTSRTVDPYGAPIANIPIRAGEVYTAYTDVNGEVRLALPVGENMLTPTQRGFFWYPPQRTVTLPPAISGQDFVGYRVLRKTAEPPTLPKPVTFGDTITYTLYLLGSPMVDPILADPIPVGTVFLSDTLQSLPDIVYDAKANTLTGPLHLAPLMSGIITYAVSVVVTATVEGGPVIVNQASIYPAAAPEQAIWSDPVTHFTHLLLKYFPLIQEDWATAP
ncbi:MAG: hypothetical protein R6W76_22270, partial [Caldilinea sp.]